MRRPGSDALRRRAAPAVRPRQQTAKKEVDVSDDKRIDRAKFLGAAGAGVGVAAALASPGLAATTAGRRAQRNAVAAAKAKPYLIGSPFPLHSFYAADGEQMKNGSGLAIDEINSAGGIAGRKIERTVIDADVATPEGVATAYRKLVNSKVDAVLVGYFQVDAPTYDIAAAYGAPYVHGNTIEAGVQRVRENPKKYSNIFNVDSTEVHYGTNFPLFIDRLMRAGQWKPKAKTVHFVEGDLGYSQTISKAAQDAFKKAGWKSMGVEKVVTPINDWGPVIRKLHSGSASVVMNCHPAPADLAAFIKQFAANPTDSLV
jgi:branched-chain amino acid transport system substrate-binding protein